MTTPGNSNTEALRAAHLLIVEDNAVNQRVASLMVERLGYTSDVVEDGLQALEALKTSTYDAVLMDCQMPIMDGYEATRHIRAFDAPIGKIPIIAVTASVLEEDRERCFAVGMNDFVAKPVELAILGAAISRAVGGSALSKPVGQDSRHSDNVIDARDAEVENDQDALRKILGEQFDEAMSAFLTSAGDRVGEMEEALLVGDMKRLYRTSHTLKGSSRSFGFNGLGDAAELVEKAAAEEDAGRASDMFAGVQVALEKAKHRIAMRST